MRSGFIRVDAVHDVRTMNSTHSGSSTGGNDLDRTIHEFLQSGSKSGNYQSNLEGILENWRLRLEQNGVTTIETVDKRAMADYAQYLTRRVNANRNPDIEGGISPATAWTYFDNVSAFLHYCKEWEYLTENPAQKAIVKSELPDRPTSDSSKQQFWSASDRNALLQHVDKRASAAIDEHGLDEKALTPVRDRALAYVLAYTGVRGAEVLRSTKDDRRVGLRWEDLNIEDGTMIVFGKSQQREPTQLPRQVHSPLQQLKRVLNPASEGWPVFVTNHAPSLYRVLPDEYENSENQTPLAMCRSLGVIPPALSTDGGRSVLKRLCKAGEIDVAGGYLKPHGARRGVGEKLYRSRGAAAAQRVLRHADPKTTSEMYSHIEASEMAEDVSQVFDDE